jgi:hypothetical protein
VVELNNNENKDEDEDEDGANKTDREYIQGKERTYL